MPDTSSAPYRAHPVTWRMHGDLADPCPARPRPDVQLIVSGIEPIDDTWFDAADGPVDTPLYLLIPVQR
ncbi:MAG: hypothetical protein ACRDSK_04825 [Actinophytocola sp.]|uniref:hypothetical protein n=1 Tax=Actinophytocola sp. TaxID=1872138 RepID=UPI003D6A4ADC